MYNSPSLLHKKYQSNTIWSSFSKLSKVRIFSKELVHKKKIILGGTLLNQIDFQEKLLYLIEDLKGTLKKEQIESFELPSRAYTILSSTLAISHIAYKLLKNTANESNSQSLEALKQI